MSTENWRVAPHRPATRGVEPVSLRHPEPGITLRRDFDPPAPLAWLRLDLAYEGSGVADARFALVFADGTRLPQRLPKTGRNRFSVLFRPIAALAAIEISVDGSAALATPALLSLTAVTRRERRLAIVRRGLGILRGDPRSFPWRLARFAIQLRRSAGGAIPPVSAPLGPAAAYALWRERFDERAEDEAFHRARASRLGARPLFTLVVDPEADTAARETLLASLRAQAYARWEVLVPEGAPTGDERVRAIESPGGRETWLADALARAEGTFVFFPRPGTAMRPHALVVFAATLERFRDAKLVYADDDDLRQGLRSDPRFKPAWSPRRFACHDYVGDPCCVAMDAVRAAGTPVGTGAAARRDLMLRVAETLAPASVVHIAQVLSHATIPVAPLSPVEAGAIVRRAADHGAPGARMLQDPRSPHPRLIAGLPPEPPLVSIVVPTRDRADLLRMSIGSIRANTRYPRFELIVVDNGSSDAETLRLFDSWAADPAIRIIRDDAPFNYSALNNRAASAARGTILALVNNDIEVQDAGWLEEMVGLALEPGVGCVGAKLRYPDGRVQHGGVATGVAGAAGHRGKRAARDAKGMVDDLRTVNEVSAVTAACLVVRKGVYAEVGGLDEAAFAIAYNDVDFCLKVARAGYRNLWTPFAELTHHESVSRGRDLNSRAAERFDRETLTLRTRWGDRLLDDPYYSPNLTVDNETGAIRTQ